MPYYNRRGAKTSIGTFNDVGRDQTNNYKIEYKTVNTQHSQDAKQLLRPFAAVEAAYDSSARYPPDKCHGGTRKAVLNDIKGWIMDVKPDSRIYWLSGAAFLGKSAISQSVAMMCRDMGRLGSSVFFSADDVNRNDIKQLFPTIAYQLCWGSKAFNRRTSKVLKSDPSVLDKKPSDLVQKLIIDPILDGIHSMEENVVVIEAINEAKDEDLLDETLKLLLEIASKTPLRFFISGTLNTSSQPFVTENSRYIRELDLSSNVYNATSDIRQFYDSRFRELRTQHRELREPPTWATGAQVERLVADSGGIFLYPVAAMKYIDCGGRKGHRQRLENVLRLTRSALTSSILDRLYEEVLSQIPISHYHEHTKSFISTLCSLFYPLPIADIATLTGYEVDDTWGHLQDLHAFFHIPGKSEPETCIRLIHHYFSTWIGDTLLAKQFVIDFQSSHSSLGIWCLKRMLSGLQRNICHLPKDGTLANVDIDGKCRTHILGSLEYSCRSWYYHLHYGSPSSEDGFLQTLQEFAETASILQWIEAMGLLHRMEEAVNVLRRARSLPGIRETIIAERIEAILRFTVDNIRKIIDWPLYIHQFVSERPGLPPGVSSAVRPDLPSGGLSPESAIADPVVLPAIATSSHQAGTNSPETPVPRHATPYSPTAPAPVVGPPPEANGNLKAGNFFDGAQDPASRLEPPDPDTPPVPLLSPVMNIPGVAPQDVLSTNSADLGRTAPSKAGFPKVSNGLDTNSPPTLEVPSLSHPGAPHLNSSDNPLIPAPLGHQGEDYLVCEANPPRNSSPDQLPTTNEENWNAPSNRSVSPTIRDNASVRSVSCCCTCFRWVCRLFRHKR